MTLLKGLCRWRAKPVVSCFALLFLLSLSGICSGQEADVAGGLKKIDVTDGFTISNLWIMVAGMLVFLMHLGFATLESGLTRAKNTVNILFKNTSIVCLGLISYAVIGFAIMYPGSFAAYNDMSDEEKATYNETTQDNYFKKNGYFACDGLGMLFMGPVDAGGGKSEEEIKAFNENSTQEYNNFTKFTDWFFQAMFAATCCTILSGAVAGRIKLSTFLVFCSIFVLSLIHI